MNKAKAIKYITEWLTKYGESSKTNGFIIGISGGIDSALTSTLCALTGKNSIVLNMPILQHKDQFDLANQHIQWLKKKFKNVSSYTINLTDSFLKLKGSLPKKVQDAHSMANTRSRLRMLTLYAFSTHYKMLVAGTGNKVEDFGVGFYTKYGDGGVDISPIADLLKSEVYALAEELGIIKPILTAAPVDGLWADNRTDEQQIGATYAELENAMKLLTRKTTSRVHKLTNREKEVIKIYKRFHSLNAHKMKPIPVCVIPKKLKK